MLRRFYTKTLYLRKLEKRWEGKMTRTARTRNTVELCPRSYDVLQRAELDNLHIRFEGDGIMPTVGHSYSL